MLRAKELAGTLTPEEVKMETIGFLDRDPYTRTEYFEIMEDRNLKPVLNWKDPGGKRGFIAVKIGKIRLIDNMDFSS
jgi:pantothenate synthetase